MKMERIAGSDTRVLRDLLGHFATGVAVVTARSADGVPHGVTINSFSSVSLTPELVLFSMTESLLSLPVYRQAAHVGISLLAEDQHELAGRFARRGADKWQGVDVIEGASGVPLLGGALAQMECAPERQIEAGDHLIFLCRLEHFSTASDKRPLLFYRGRYGAHQEHPAAPGA